mgnify:CR=1 FL=1
MELPKRLPHGFRIHFFILLSQSQIRDKTELSWSVFFCSCYFSVLTIFWTPKATKSHHSFHNTKDFFTEVGGFELRCMNGEIDFLLLQRSCCSWEPSYNSIWSTCNFKWEEIMTSKKEFNFLLVEQTLLSFRRFYQIKETFLLDIMRKLECQVNIQMIDLSYILMRLEEMHARHI